MANEEGVLRARPGEAAPADPGLRGMQPLGLAPRRDGLLYLPQTPAPQAPLLLALHGAGGNAVDIMGLFTERAERDGFVVVAPDSRGRTWDVILGDYGPDVALIDRALEAVFARVRIDPQRIAVTGFSDGASYALSIGLNNGDLFGHVLAFSPGFMAPTRQKGRARVFISHGIHDEVLPIDRCSRRLAPALTRGGYDLDYREFDGPHIVPPEMVARALDRFLG